MKIERKEKQKKSQKSKFLLERARTALRINMSTLEKIAKIAARVHEN